MARMKLLVIGGTGVLSSAVVNEALASGIEVTMVNRGLKKTSIPYGVTLIKADYRNEQLMRTKLEGLHFDAVIDFICFTPQQLEYSVKLLYNVADQYVFISTSCVYNTRITGVKTEESEKCLEDWYYSVDKWKCECLLKELSDELKFNYSVIRPCVTYDNTRIPYGIMPAYGYHWTFVARILAGKPIIRWDEGKAKWSMMRVEDFAVGVVGILGKKEAYGEAYNLSGDEAYDWNDVINVVASYLDLEPVLFDVTSEEYKVMCPDRAGEITGRSLDAIVSNAKIKQLVPSFKSSFSLEIGVRKTLVAYKYHHFQFGIDWAFDADTDRMIADYCKKHKIKSRKYKLSFVNYLGNATLADRFNYYKTYYKDSLAVKLFIKSGVAVKRIIRKLK